MIDDNKEIDRIKKELALINIEIDNKKFAKYCNHLIEQIDNEFSRLDNMKDELAKYHTLAPFQISKFISDLEEELSNVHNFYETVGSIYNKLSCLKSEVTKLCNAKNNKQSDKKRLRKNSS